MPICDADGYGLIESTAGDATDGIGAGQDRHADGPTVEGVALGAFGRCHVEDCESEGKGEDELRQQGWDQDRLLAFTTGITTGASAVAVAPLR